MKTLTTHIAHTLSLTLVLALALLAACSSEEEIGQTGGSLSAEPVVSGTRAEGGSVAPEDNLNETNLGGGLQILLFDKQGKRVQYWNVSDAQQSVESVLGRGHWMETLGINAGETYDVYAIANGPKAEIESCQSAEALKALTHTDEDICKIHTGDHRFMMDQHLEWTPSAESKQKISVDALQRAAAKLRLDVCFDVEGYTAGEPHFRLVNYNTKTSVLEKENSDGAVSVTEMEDYAGKSGTFTEELDGVQWNQFIAYTYPFSWTGNMDRRPSVLVEVGMTNETTKVTHNYYYRIPLRPSEETLLERNHIYTVKAKITSLGATSELKYDTEADLKYSVLPWTEEDININAGDRKYLLVTPDLAFMRNVTESNEIDFYASGKCACKILEVYHYDKNSKKITMGSSDDQYPTVSLTGESSGHLQVTAKVPTNLTVKFIKVRIYLESDVNTYKDVLIKQYPIEYALNIEGWYSTRSTSGWVDWQTGQTAHRVANKYQDYVYDRIWYNGGWHEYYAFTAKVCEKSYSDKKPLIYGMTETKYRNNYITSKNELISNLKNNRMYVIQITSTNGDYVISKPNIDYSDPNSKNYGSKDSLVVSPAFMIASQLGAVVSSGFDAKTAITHCKTYREVGTDGTVYDGWRLPTKKEIKVIVDYQVNQESPIDTVLAGNYYRTLSQGEVCTDMDPTDKGRYVRCVRDMSAAEIKKLEETKQ